MEELNAQFEKGKKWQNIGNDRWTDERGDLISYGYYIHEFNIWLKEQLDERDKLIRSLRNEKI